VSLDLDSIQSLGAAMIVLFLGSIVVDRVGFLRNNDIPVPVAGGIVIAGATSVLYLGFDVGVSFDMAMRGPLLLAFFASVGLGADLKSLARGGPQLIVFALICLVYLILQDGMGLLVARALDLHPLVGLLSSSITLAGGHGTGAAYAQQFADTRNLASAMELAMACATFGLVIGGLLGGPVAGRLIRRHGLEPEHPQASVEQVEEYAKPIDGESMLRTLFSIICCLVAGQFLSTVFSGAAIQLPLFVWCLFVGCVIRNLGPLVPGIHVHAPTVSVLGNLSLSLFLAMALMSLRLWDLLGLAGPLLVLLAVHTLGLALFATFVTYRFMGRNYDAAIIAGGHCGFGMGATPTAVANIQALTRRFGPAPQAFLIVPLTGAFFIDLLNAIVIQGFLSLPIPGL
jgi:ESS family glutamate:Na+ symporter